MEKYFFINRIELGQTAFYLNLAMIILLACGTAHIFFRNGKSLSGASDGYFKLVLSVWLGLLIALLPIEASLVFRDAKDLYGVSVSRKLDIVWQRFSGDANLAGFIDFAKANIKPGKTAIFLSPDPTRDAVARYYLYPEVKIVGQPTIPEYVLLYGINRKDLNINLPLKLFKSLSPEMAIYQVAL